MFEFLQLLAWYAVATVATWLLMPKPKFDKPKRAGISDFSLPTADETRAIPVVFGTCKTAPAILWYGDYGYTEIEKKVRTTPITSTKITLGYYYKLGFQFALTHGHINKLVGVWADTRKVWSGETALDNNGTVANVAVNYEWQQAEGSEFNERIAAQLEIYTKGCSSDYLRAQQPNGMPAYPHITQVIWKGASANSGTICTGSTPPPVYFEVQRLPDLMDSGFVRNYDTQEAALLAAFNAVADVQGDANPAMVLAEVLTHRAWGCGISMEYIDRASFLAAAQTLHAEGNGTSFIWETQQAVESIAKSMLNQINGVLDVDHHTGLIRLRLVREADQPVLTIGPSNVRDGSFKSFSRTSIDDSVNSMRISFVDRAAGYIDRQAEAQDLGNIAQLGSIVSTESAYSVSRADLAATLALRDLRAVSGSLGRISLDLIVDRKNLLRPGDAVLLNWPPLGISNLKMRVVTARYGEGFTAVVGLDLVQDVFASGSALYASHIPGIDLGTPATPPARTPWARIFLAPSGLTGDTSSKHLLFCCGAPEDGSASGYRLVWWNGQEARTAANAAYNQTTGSTSFAALCHLDGDITASSSPFYLVAASDADKATANKHKAQLVLMAIDGKELAMAYVELQPNGQLLRVDIYQRGMYGTTPVAATAGAEVVLLYGYAIDSAALATTSENWTLFDNYGLAQTFGPGGVLDIDAQNGSYDAALTAGTNISNRSI